MSGTGLLVSEKQRFGVGAVLGLDTSSAAGSIALVLQGRVLGGLDVAGGLDHSVRLLPGVEFLLQRLRLRPADLAAVAVSVGPGSFTGVRVGLATALGLARAAGIPAVGVGSLEALAELAPPGPGWICPWMDAGRGEVYAAAFREGGARREECLPPVVGSPETCLSRLPPSQAAVFVGDGARRHRDRIVAAGGRVDGEGPWFLARAVARLGESRLHSGAAHPPSPAYVRPPDARRPATGP